MSLILEALRKSEAERRRGQAPDVVVELPPPRAPGRVELRRWLWPVLGLVTLFALLPVLAIGWIARDSWRAPDAPASAAPVAEAAPPAAPAITPVAAPAVVPRAPAPVAVPLPPPDAPIAATAAETPPAATPAPPPAAVPAAAEPAMPVGMAGVRLSMHLWNEDPARRLVVLNGQRMAEGDHHDGITLVEILRDGVVVERDGARARIDLP